MNFIFLTKNIRISGFWRSIFYIVLVLSSASLKAENLVKKDTIKPNTAPYAIVNYHFKGRSLILPVSLIAVGAMGQIFRNMSDYHLLDRNENTYDTQIDDIAEWSVLALPLALDLLGHQKHTWKDQLGLIFLAECINGGMVIGIKHWTAVTRPNGSPYSFPSGHTANAFLGAHMAWKEFHETDPLLAYSSYAIAAGMGFLRIRHNKHWIADTFAGAGFGILSVELSYMIYFPLRNMIAKTLNKRWVDHLVIAPVLGNRIKGMNFAYCF